jgi:DNA-binding response OmpR family regulator
MATATVDPVLMVVEDEERLSFSMRQFLTQRGFQVRLAHTAAAALAFLDQGPPDAAILDVHLPDGSGLDVLERLRQMGMATPVVVITADDSQPVRQRAEQLGFTAFLTKPVQPLELLRVLEQVLRPGP